MKKLLVVALLAWGCAANSVAFSHKHRHHPRKEVVQKQATADANESTEAFSDTTAVDESVADKPEKDSAYMDEKGTVDDANNDDRDLIDDFSHEFGSHSMSEVVVVSMFIFFIFVAPFIVLIMVIRYLIKRHNDNVALAMKAMEKGYPLSSVSNSGKFMNSYDRRKWDSGVKQVFLGIGLIVFFWILGVKAAVGVGFLVLFMGLGQMVIGRHSNRNNGGIDAQFDDTLARNHRENVSQPAEKHDDFDPQI